MRKLIEADVLHKKVIVRVDFNVPIENNEILDDNRIKESLKTINYLIDNNAKIILLSHLGKIKEESDKEKNSLRIVYERLKTLLNTNVYFADNSGEETERIINNLNDKDVVLLENTRYKDIPDKKESSSDENLSAYWASLGDIFVLDAFASSHRAHASTYGIGKYLPSYIGFLVEKELNILNEILSDNNKDIILGGAKVEDKLPVVKNLLTSSNHILIGGVMSFTFLKAIGYNVGPNFVDEESINEIRELYQNNKNRIFLPLDFVTENGIEEIDNLKSNAFDIGPKTTELFKNIIKNSSLIVWNGTLGKYEDPLYEKGTKSILTYLNENNIKSVIAGGDTGSAAHKYNLDFYYISTGGGATLEYLSGVEFKTLENMK